MYRIKELCCMLSFLICLEFVEEEQYVCLCQIFEENTEEFNIAVRVCDGNNAEGVCSAVSAQSTDTDLVTCECKQQLDETHRSV